MESFARPLRRIYEDASWFARARELRLLWVGTSAPLRSTALAVAMAQENHADNKSLFLRFEDAWDEEGWANRLSRLYEQAGAKAEGLGKGGHTLGPFQPRDEAPGAGAFGAALLRLVNALPRPLEGLVVVLAPVRIDDAVAFTSEVGGLLQASRLTAVRWIVVEGDSEHLAPLVNGLGAEALRCPCLLDPADEQADLAALVAQEDDEPRGSWRSAGAMPDVEPPPRQDLPPAPDDEALIEAGLSPAFVNGGGRRLKRLILRGALAWREGDAVQALTLQAEAASLCAELALPREQILNLMVLGSYALAAGVPERARGIYERAAALAGEGGYRDHQAQAELALGMLAVLAGDPPLAAAHYARAGRVAEEGEAPLLAIECWRMAGQLALDHEVELSAVDCWKRALALADALEPPLAQSTSAAEVARALAALCRRRGLTAQAESLERQSVALEQGPPPAPQPLSSEAR